MLSFIMTIALLVLDHGEIEHKRPMGLALDTAS